MAPEPERPLVARLALPPDGTACAVVAAALFVGFFVALAVYNLTDFSQLPVCGAVASVLWLALVAFCLALGLSQAGLWGSVVACLGPFSSRQFVEVRRETNGTVIGFGYELFRGRFYFLRVAPEQVTSVEMSTGQATALAGRDMNDWSVVLWYRADGEPTFGPWPGLRTDDFYIVGPARAREDTAELFAAVVAFLRAAGVDLRPTESETEFRHSRE